MVIISWFIINWFIDLLSFNWFKKPFNQLAGFYVKTTSVVHRLKFHTKKPPVPICRSGYFCFSFLYITCNDSVFCKFLFINVAWLYLTYLWRTVKVDLWKSDIPVWKTQKFWKHLGCFVNIKSMQDWLSTLLKHLGSLIRLFKLCWNWNLCVKINKNSKIIILWRTKINSHSVNDGLLDFDFDFNRLFGSVLIQSFTRDIFTLRKAIDLPRFWFLSNLIGVLQSLIGNFPSAKEWSKRCQF